MSQLKYYPELCLPNCQSCIVHTDTDRYRRESYRKTLANVQGYVAKGVAPRRPDIHVYVALGVRAARTLGVRAVCRTELNGVGLTVQRC